MRTKPLNEIIDECIEYSTLVILGSGSDKYCSRFLRFPGSYTNSCDLLKQSIHNYNERIIFIELFERYMNVNEFKA